MTRDTGASEPVGTLHAIVLDVNDLESCTGFWSEVLGKEISFKTDKYCRIGGDDDTPSLLLQKVIHRQVSVFFHQVFSFLLIFFNR